MSRRRLLLSCEHAGREVPERWRACFTSAEARDALDSHRGWDLGALPVAQRLAARSGAPLFVHDASRLLVDANRSPSHPRVFSAWTRGLPLAERRALLEALHAPHRARVRAAALERRPCLHVAVHSFTPVWEGRPRDVDVGLLYDPRRPSERRLAQAWQARLRETLPSELRVRRNAPYRGRDDGLPTALRAELDDAAYAGFELELNQRRLRAAGEAEALAERLASSLDALLSDDLG